MKNKFDKTAAGVMLLLLVAAMLPVMYLGRYNHPTGDDYYYGATTYRVWQETGSVLQTVTEAIKGVEVEYGRWQGTYSALLLMYLPPNIWGNLPYRLVTAVLLLLLSGGIFFFGRQLLFHQLKLSAPVWIIVCSCMTFMCVETVPSQGETFFWYNGSMYYTGYLAVTLFFLGLILRYMRRENGWLLAVLFLLAAFIAGGNYVTLLPTLLGITLLFAWLLWRRENSAWGIMFTTAVMFLGLMFSAAAPGNRIRQDGMWQIPAWKAVAKALVQGVAYTGAWTGIWWVLTAFVITPFLWRDYKKISFRFPYPVIVVGLLYGIFCAMSCPTFLTMNSTGPARAVAVVYYGFVLFSFAAYGYLLGYVQRIWREKRETRKAADRGIAVWCVGIIILLGFSAVTGSAENFTTVKAVQLLASGQARAYEEEYQERYRLFLDESVQELVLQSYVNQPDMLYVGDFSEDVLEPTNAKVAEYFGKKSVRVAYD